MLTEAVTRTAILGLDVGNSPHWACHAIRRGEVLESRPVANTEHELDDLFGRVDAGTLVFAGQVRNIGSIAISGARLGGLGLPSMARLHCSRATRRPTNGTPSHRQDSSRHPGLAPTLLSGRNERLEAARSMAAQTTTWSPAPPLTKTDPGASSWKATRRSRR